MNVLTDLVDVADSVCVCNVYSFAARNELVGYNLSKDVLVVAKSEAEVRDVTLVVLDVGQLLVQVCI